VTVREVLPDVVRDIDPVRVVVDGEDLAADPAPVPIERLLDEEVRHAAPLFRFQVAPGKSRPSPRVDQVVKTEPRNPFPLHHVQKTRKLRHVLRAHRETHTRRKSCVSRRS